MGAAITAGLLVVSISAPAQAMDEMVKPTANLTVTAAAENTVRVSSVKGNTLNPGDRSFLMIEPYGAAVNLTRFNGLDRIDSIAEHAVMNWRNSHYHNLTLLDERATCIGVGVTVYNGTAYAVMIAGIPNSVSPI